MIDYQLKMDYSLVDKNEIYHPNGLITHFEFNINSLYIQLDYKYKGEPNNNRIQLELSGNIGEKNIIDFYGLDRNIELPYQYPKYFELISQSGDFVAIPHNKGVYILQVDNNEKYLIKYQTDRFQTCFFVDNLFVLIEDKGFKIVDLIDFTERAILFDNEKLMFINAIQVREKLIYAIVQDVNTNRMKLFVYDRFNFSNKNFTEYNLSDLVETKSFVDKLRYEKQSKLAGIPDFNYNSLIDSWRFTKNHKWNSLIGRIEHWFQPEKDGEYFIRKERYDYIELEIKTFANRVDG